MEVEIVTRRRLRASSFEIRLRAGTSDSDLASASASASEKKTFGLLGMRALTRRTYVRAYLQASRPRKKHSPPLHRSDAQRSESWPPSRPQHTPRSPKPTSPLELELRVELEPEPEAEQLPDIHREPPREQNGERPSKLQTPQRRAARSGSRRGTQRPRSRLQRTRTHVHAQGQTVTRAGPCSSRGHRACGHRLPVTRHCYCYC